jgi:ketopantoate reductase
MKILMVGAGAVGSVYAYFAHKGGAEVTFLIKPKHRAHIENGIQLYHFPTFGKKPEHVLFKDFDLIDDPSQIAKTQYDMIWISVPSTAIRDGNWLEVLGQHAGKATLVSLQPGLNDRDFILEKTKIPEAHLVSGSIPLLSYLAPMPGESFEKPGYAFWLPPGQNVFMSLGETSRRKEVVDLLNRGGFKTKESDDHRKQALIGEAILRMVVVGLERSEWSFDRFMNGENIILATDSMKEALPILAKAKATKNPMDSFVKRQLIRPSTIKGLLKGLQWIAPFDVESFFRVHFTKVEDQMHMGMKDLVELGKKGKFPTTTLSIMARQK